jgi:hypothetical protein
LLVSFADLSVCFSCRDSTSQALAIQVGTPRRGNSQRMTAKYAAKNNNSHNHSGIKLLSTSATTLALPARSVPGKNPRRRAHLRGGAAPLILKVQ